MFVATATRGSMPNCNSAGTVMSDVLPVTTLITLVRKKMAMSASSSSMVKRVAFFGFCRPWKEGANGPMFARRAGGQAGSARLTGPHGDCRCVISAV